ncbi:hypothetical protein A8H31_28505 [Burkholderia thailandensis]|nr:hypothetical protein A8H31_28505 [Burkholderia thailandensis]NOK44126.1 hypothetical protein [Burkholderia thailandensis]NOK54060.1 hypothetical protein [Burkholderia thailandensis]PNE67949.1 hypothetical protein A8H38_17255 [Burkholderia thailandensis]PNE79954.1 hypothetical protein A8H34_17815 [Burkholderia thailandensis]
MCVAAARGREAVILAGVGARPGGKPPPTVRRLLVCNGDERLLRIGRLAFADRAIVETRAR